LKKDKLKVYALEIILVAILAFALFVPNFSRIVVAVGLAIAAIVITIMIKKRNIISIYNKQVIIIFVILAVIYLVSFYLLRFVFWVL